MTIYDIAKEANVSASTVSRVMNNKPGIKAETREKVRRIMEKYNFSPDETARGLVQQASKTIGLLIADVRISYYREGIHNIIEELAKLGYCCILLNTGISSENRAEYIRLLSSRKVEGAILIGSEYQCDEVREAISLYMKDIPVVMVNGWLDLPNVYGVLAEERSGTERLFDFLFERGYRHPALVISVLTVSNRKKLEGVRDCLEKRGIAEEPLLCLCGEASGVGWSETQKLLEEHPETDVIFYSSDVFAVNGLRALQERSVAVPEQVAVVSGEESKYATLLHPFITALDSRIEDVFMLACRDLIDILGGGTAPKVQTVMPEINVRETTR